MGLRDQRYIGSSTDECAGTLLHLILQADDSVLPGRAGPGEPPAGESSKEFKDGLCDFIR
jgi:hypothetical protein